MRRRFLLLSLYGLALTGQTIFRNPNSSSSPNAIYATWGLTFQTGRTAVIDSSGQIGAVQGNATDCVLVNGASGPCGTGGGGGGSITYSDHETPGGSVNGSNAAFTLANTPTSGSLSLYRNGQLQHAGVDFSLSGTAITFATAPGSGDWLDASYRH